MHDYFQILGVPEFAPAEEIRRALRRRPGHPHPDFACDVVITDRRPLHRLDEVAVDFVEMGAVIDRMRAAFFA
jgi:hypothetical protein